MIPPAGGGLAAGLLAPAAWLYGLAVALRNRHYDRTEARRRAALPVVSVGNLTVGGTGKTPLVAWIARWLLARQGRPCVVSRGYGGRAGRGPVLVSAGDGPRCPPALCGDEPYLLAGIPGLRVVVGSDRVAGAAAAQREGADVVLLDDGFQHRRLARDLDVVLLDGFAPFGNRRLLPAGPLREPIAGLSRADLVLVTRGPSPERLSRIESEVRRHAARAPVLAADHRAVGFVEVGGAPAPPPRRALAFCGIGNPQRFRADLEGTGVELIDFRALRDHHVYRPRELAALQAAATAGGAVLVTTEKDLARLHDKPLPGVLALRIELLLPHAEPLTDALERLRIDRGPDGP